MSKLNYLGGAIESFYKDDVNNPQLRPSVIAVKENGNRIAYGTAAEIKDKLQDKFDRKILKWDACFHNVTLEI